jgi:integrase
MIAATGLRVSELAGVAAEDCKITDEAVVFSFVGKGGKAAKVTVNADDSPQLHERLKVLIEGTPTGKKVFYSAMYLQTNAKKLGFGCHDLRRAYAKLEYQKCRNKAAVSEKLRHSNKRTTNIYLKSKVEVETKK